MADKRSAKPWWSSDSPARPARLTHSVKKRVLFSLVGVISFTLLMGAAFTSPQERPRRISPGIIENSPSLDALVATCTGIVEWENEPDLLVRLPWDSKSGTAEAQVAKALMSSAIVRPGFYTNEDLNTPSVADVAVYLSNGGTVAWYSPDESAAVAANGLEAILGVLSEDGRSVLALPWPKDKMNRMPSLSRTASGNRILYMKWGRAQSCAVASDAVLNTFIESDLED